MPQASFRSSILKTLLKVGSRQADVFLNVTGALVVIQLGTMKADPLTKIGPFDNCHLKLDRERLSQLAHKRPEVKVTWDRNGATLS